ncbi:MAG: hypothetical protein LBC39_01535 [Methanobrevibacter sp.]|jgi:TctA family transporter|nr:hypothetical protein [Candidatus Methanovirga aequatorialis]
MMIKNEQSTVCNEQSTTILRVLGLVGGIFGFSQFLSQLTMMMQMQGTKALAQLSSYPEAIVSMLILPVLAIVASTLYFKNEKIMSILLLIAGIVPMILNRQPDPVTALIFVAGFIGLYRFIKSKKTGSEE